MNVGDLNIQKAIGIIAICLTAAAVALSRNGNSWYLLASAVVLCGLLLVIGLWSR